MKDVEILKQLGLSAVNSGACGKSWIDSPGGRELVSLNPATGERIAVVRTATEECCEQVVA
jgi:acyl-CoA reductase-like NAD-dependent aldehyde dehydrogenase